jgi:hypothetical protein
MQIEYANSYTEHGTNIHGKLAIVRYSDAVTNHEFLGAYKRGGLFENLDRAKALISQYHPKTIVCLGIPDLVVKLPED